MFRYNIKITTIYSAGFRYLISCPLYSMFDNLREGFKCAVWDILIYRIPLKSKKYYHEWFCSPRVPQVLLTTENSNNISIFLAEKFELNLKKSDVPRNNEIIPAIKQQLSYTRNLKY